MEFPVLPPKTPYKNQTKRPVSSFCKFPFDFYVNWFNLESSVYEIESYSTILYNFFVLQFLLVGFILLVVLIVSIHFTNFNVKNVKSQNSIKQIACTITNC